MYWSRRFAPITPNTPSRCLAPAGATLVRRGQCDTYAATDGRHRFFRLVTNPRVFVSPDTIEDAVKFLDALVSSPGVELQASGSEWPLLRGKLLTARLQGNSVTDAWITAATEALSEHLVTFDSDFRRLLPSRDLTVLENSR